MRCYWFVGVMKIGKRQVSNKLIYSAIIVLFIVIMQPFLLYYFFQDIAVIFPKGWVAERQRDLLILIQIIMLLFIIPIYILTFVFSWWYRADNEESTYDPHLVDNKLAEVIWWGVPFIMTVFVAVITWIQTHELDPYKPLESDRKAIVVQAVALQWNWLFIYPEERIATLNYLKIPKDTPIHFKITADAPMNALWIPKLGGMIYAMPGMQTQLFLIANETGRFRGSSANISGEGFAGMTFKTDAVSDDEFLEWVSSAKRSEKSLDWKEYTKIAKPQENSGIATYRLTDDNLFMGVIMKFMNPPSKA